MEHNHIKNKDPDKKELKMYRKKYGIYDTTIISVEAGNFGALKTDDKDVYGYYIVKFVSGPYIIQYESDFLSLL